MFSFIFKKDGVFSLNIKTHNIMSFLTIELR
nr:MAG TPA: hypothetical protein [Caudoviricetes sp.]DAY08169.1 MAG TPA: hypothetical protein [Herelleviridae sp.]